MSHHNHGNSAAKPFLTISRQAGAGGRSFERRLAEKLNETDPGELPWTVWDNELVETAAAKRSLPSGAVVSDEQPNWLEEALGSLAIKAGDGVESFRHSCQTIRALARMGRVIIVGRGGAFVTADLPGGVHLRLVAPLGERIARTAQRTGASTALAAEMVREKDAARAEFYRRRWPTRALAGENFTATFNTAAISPQRLTDSVTALIPKTACCGCGGKSTSCARKTVTWVSGALSAP
jgi:hypothetical protein